MGLIENGVAQVESNVVEQSKTPGDLDQDRKYDTLTPGNYGMDHERFVSETVEQKEVSEAQIIEKTSVSALEKSDEVRETRPNDEVIIPNEDRENPESALENVKISFDSNYLEVASQNGFTALEHMGIPPGTVSFNPSAGGKLEPVLVEATNDSGLLENDDIGSSGQRRKRKAKLKGPASSSLVLRSKMPEKPKAPESIETVKEDSAIGEKKKRGRKRKDDMQKSNVESIETVKEDGAIGEKKKRGRKRKVDMQQSNVESIETVKEDGAIGEKKKRGRKRKDDMQKSNVNEFSRTKTHLRYLLHRINYEQNLIDAYSAEGWRGQSVDKLKPEKELEKAKSRILGYKLKIRALFQCLDQSLALGKLPESLFDSKGEIDSEDIFCAKCGSKDLTLDNDIILCDGACERGFHQFCLEPPLLKIDIPPGDESWLCPGCECKADCIDILKEKQEARISIIDSWEKIFPEAAAAASGKTMDDGPGSSSDDSEDEEYDPDKPDSSEKVEEDKSSSDESSDFSASGHLAASKNNEQYLGLPSDDSEDDDFDPSAPHQDNQVKKDSSSSDFSSDSEDLEALIEDETTPSEDPSKISPSAQHKQTSLGVNEEIPKVGRKKRQSIKDELSYLMEASAEPLSGKRRVERLDYKKLNDETYGDSSDSSDEDFDDTITRKKSKTDTETTEVKSEPLVLNQIEKKHIPKRTRRNHTDVHTDETSVKVGSASASAKRSTHKRLGEATTQRLYASFSVNQYPDRAMKDNLAKELGLTIQQVSKWFENMRWSVNHRPQMESDSAERPPEPQSIIGADGTRSDPKMDPLESSTISAQNQNHIVKPHEEILQTGASGDSSGTQETRTRKGNLGQDVDDKQSVLHQHAESATS